MSAPIIEVRGVSKRYQLGRIGFTSLRHEIERWWSKGKNGNGAAAPQDFWALRDVSFEVQRGEVIGIIGRNGAGKSTLLKILSEITEPTAGEIRLRGRTASLLEVGTGFHPELSGRENIFLNGAILGMRRAEIARKFDEIVAFAEVEQFIDTPVKRYSSGMYVRLAFAVAAHLEPEILIVDEVLAVGDQNFQQKCLGKMQDVTRKHGRTVLFVSHNLSAIQMLCARAIYLDHGAVAAAGPVNDCIAGYTRKGGASANEGKVDLKNIDQERQGDGQARLTMLEISRADGNPSATFAMGETLVLKFKLVAHQRLRDFVLGFSIDTMEERVLICSNHHDSMPRGPLPAGEHAFEVRIKDVYLAPGTYGLTAAITPGDHPGVHDIARNCARFTIEPRHSEVTPQNRYYLDERPGFLRCAMDWRKC